MLIATPVKMMLQHFQNMFTARVVGFHGGTFFTISRSLKYTHQWYDLFKEICWAEWESTDDSQQVASHMH